MEIVERQANREHTKEGRLAMQRRLVMVLLSLVLLFGCATTAQQGPSGMKKISQTPGYTQAMLQSFERGLSTLVIGFGYICPNVTDIYTFDPVGHSNIVTCYDGQSSTNYRVVQSENGEWYSVAPTDERPAFSVEHHFTTLIYGQGFQCSKVTEIKIIKYQEIFRATCIEGNYKMVKDKAGAFTVTPW